MLRSGSAKLGFDERKLASQCVFVGFSQENCATLCAVLVCYCTA
ncbi:hypothetical protein KPSA1_04260 [Pseudomonas syringae pv. actinidiae]|uniref:Uncharacterized protein n=1 Tax=Pseudomonas syringae pv. actinidiae TaxID=103796 RepID=A0A2V0QD27_PSESF|nr:hypothetical protein KPSA1_04260 [Pseudomonas syringae pv. actinidiae]